MGMQFREFVDSPFDISAARALRERAFPLSERSDLEPLLERVGSARFVLLGASTHGTAEFQSWRARLSQILMEKKGFSFIAAEGNWPECYRLHRYICGDRTVGISGRETLRGFQRWPAWIWANEEVVAFVEWLRRYHEARRAPANMGFYGLDVYSLWDSLHFLDQQLGKLDPCLSEEFRKAHRCFDAFDQDVHSWAKNALVVESDCERHVVELLERLRERTSRTVAGLDGEQELLSEQNAWVLLHAEEYYHTMLHGGAASWNIRDTHMADTLERLMRFHGPKAKALVWAHNMHIGDARYTHLVDAGMTNLGQILRQRYGEDEVVLIGFASHHGRVIASSAWDVSWANMILPPARVGSWEDHLHAACPHNALFVWGPNDMGSASPLMTRRGHRAVGVVYHPEREDALNYTPTVLPRRYDALCYFDEVHALHPLHLKEHPSVEFPETFPSAV